MNARTAVNELMANKLGEYYLTVVRHAKNDLHNPRVTFNWGYHDAKSDMKSARPLRDMSTHTDPYYAAGYTAAQGLYTLDSSSEISWRSWVENLGDVDYDNTARAVLESLILGQEYLFNKKSPRSSFRDFTWNHIVSGYDGNMPAGSPKQMKIKLAVLHDFSLI